MDLSSKEVIGNLGEVIFTDTLGKKATFQRARSDQKGCKGRRGVHTFFQEV